MYLTIIYNICDIGAHFNLGINALLVSVVCHNYFSLPIV
jgi:hypothetical protein